MSSGFTEWFSVVSTGSRGIEPEERGANIDGSNYSTPQRNLFLFIYEGRRVVAMRPQTYLCAVDTCRKLFPDIPWNSGITFQSKELDVCEGQLAEISPDSFEVVVPLITSLVVKGAVSINGAPRGALRQIEPGMFLSGRKPVIYLSSPREIEATVRLSLVPQWSLSVIYPVVSSKPRSASSYEEVEWQVRVYPNGDLTELTTGLDVAYLFWEAQADPQIPISPPPSPVPGQGCLDSTEGFNPAAPVLTDFNSVVLPVASITPYLDRTLKVLGLHTEARTSFITYWLPSFLEHKYVALRFLPQTAYEKAAPLKITPRPDNITRVFMLFQGIGEEELIDWKHSQARSAEDVTFWANVAGVNLEKTLDPAAFRVLEWGGMEVLRSKSPLLGD